jgi:hypothetical protein
MIQLTCINDILIMYLNLSGRYPLYNASIYFIEQIFFLSGKSYRANYFFYRAFKFHRLLYMLNREVLFPLHTLRLVFVFFFF